MAGCPKCGNIDIETMELLQAWKDIERLEGLLRARPVQRVTVREMAPDPALLRAYKEVEELKKKLQEAMDYTAKTSVVVPVTPVEMQMLTDTGYIRPVISIEDPMWQERYNKIKEAYIKTRLEVSGSFGNWSGDTRRRVLENELSAELGFLI